ncbi:type III pantothenate kinase [Corallincola spongiicola]|uniref:Type III pantothenate kinase n=1 Tax=Corallincola spongiicola TaxID=2520508 RepID=A0ABY1WKN0_9GAMM|nr:type III pantothenate kinase [Corallincola spongiicola]
MATQCGNVKLLIDIGNTRAKLYSLDGGGLTLLKSSSHQQLPVDTESLLACRAYSQIWVASVAQSAVVATLSEAVAPFAVNFNLVKTPRSAYGLINAYAKYESLGIDRWLAMLGGRQQCKRPFIVIDFGTAITVDLVDEFGQHKGGWIAPGYRAMTNVLLSDTSEVTADQAAILSGSRLTFGVSTEQCVSEGIRSALIGYYQQAVTTAQTSLGSKIPVRVFLTGGDAAQLPAQILKQAQLCPELVLEGLAVYANAEKSSDY